MKNLSIILATVIFPSLITGEALCRLIAELINHDEHFCSGDSTFPILSN